MKSIYCTGCKTKIGELASGSRLKKDIGYLCSDCHSSYTSSKLGDSFRDIKRRNNSDIPDGFGDIFGDLFKGK